VSPCDRTIFAPCPPGLPCAPFAFSVSTSSFPALRSPPDRRTIANLWHPEGAPTERVNARRSLVTSAAALPALAVMPPGIASVEPDPILAAMERYQAAHVASLAEGTPVDVSPLAAREALAKTAPTTPRGLVTYLDFVISESGELSSPDFVTFLFDGDEENLDFARSLARAVRGMAGLRSAGAISSSATAMAPRPEADDKLVALAAEVCELNNELCRAIEVTDTAQLGGCESDYRAAQAAQATISDRIDDAIDAMDEIRARSIRGLAAKARVADLLMRDSEVHSSIGRSVWMAIDDLLAMEGAQS
jgi:hypothetical protein